MANYTNKTQSDNQNLSNLTGAKFKRLDGSVTTPITIIPSTTGGRLLRVILNTNGATVLLRTGSRVIAVIALDAPEGSFNYGVYCENGLIAECGGVVDATVVFG